ncbi:hypothetical protein SLE2022_240570 [Rubroshorea leprosula]
MLFGRNRRGRRKPHSHTDAGEGSVQEEKNTQPPTSQQPTSVYYQQQKRTATHRDASGVTGEKREAAGREFEVESEAELVRILCEGRQKSKRQPLGTLQATDLSFCLRLDFKLSAGCFPFFSRHPTCVSVCGCPLLLLVINRCGLLGCGRLGVLFLLYRTLSCVCVAVWLASPPSVSAE